MAVGPEVNDLVDALLAQPGPDTTEPVQTTIGGFPATLVDLEVPEGADLSSCHLADYGPPGLQIWFSERRLQPDRGRSDPQRFGRARRVGQLPDLGQNDGNVADGIRVKGPGTTTRFVVRYTTPGW